MYKGYIMKKLITLLLLGLASTLYAHEGFRHHGYYGGGYYSNNWVAPAIIGGVIGYELGRPQVYTPPPVIVQQPPVIYTPQPIVQQPPLGYHWQEMIDPVTNQRKVVLVPN
jgi:hypothetical protein